MHPHTALIEKFYTAFSRKDYATMQSCYHEEVEFTDPAFPLLKGIAAKAMWQMLITRSTDLRIEFSNVLADDQRGSCHWEAYYTFTTTGKKVHNKIDASFEFKDGKIYRHKDTFGFYQWASQALGLAGILLGWTPFLSNKVQQTAQQNLQKFMEKNNLS
jgi:ketosteroid isomerase-like protein